MYALMIGIPGVPESHGGAPTRKLEGIIDGPRPGRRKRDHFGNKTSNQKWPTTPTRVGVRFPAGGTKSPSVLQHVSEFTSVIGTPSPNSEPRM